MKKEVFENLLALIAIIMVMVVAFFFFDFSQIKDFVLSAGIFGPLVFILAKASTLVFAPVSGSPLYPLAGALFGFWPGVIYLAIGDAIGGSIAFWLSRKFGKKIVERFAKGNLPMIEKAINMIGSIKGFIITRVCFAPLPEVACYAGGLTKIKFLPFLIIHILIGLIPTIILVGSGSLLASLNSFWGLILILVLGLLVALIGGGIFYLFYKHQQKNG